MPARLADFASRVYNKLFCKPLPAELSKDPLPQSERVLSPQAPQAPQTVAVA